MNTNRVASNAIFAAMTLACLVSCSSVGYKEPASERADRAIVTGSNIPRKDPSSVGTKTVDAAALEQLKTSGTGSPAAPSGK